MIKNIVIAVASVCAYVTAGKIIDPTVKVVSKNFGLVSKIGTKCIGYSAKIAIASGVAKVIKKTYSFYEGIASGIVKAVDENNKKSEPEEINKDDISKKPDKDFYKKAFENWKKETTILDSNYSEKDLDAILSNKED